MKNAEIVKLSNVMDKVDLEQYVNEHDDMCLELTQYGRYEIFAEFMCGPRGEYCNVYVYETRRGGKMVKIIEFRYCPTYNEENECYETDEIYDKAIKMLNVYNS